MEASAPRNGHSSATMNILQINVRASQGGAGRVCLDLHRRLRQAGVDSHLLYGYASGIADDPQVEGEPAIVRTGTKPGVLGNYAWHRLFGRDLFTPGFDRIRAAVAAADLVHVHAPHHYFMNWDHMVAVVNEHRKPIVMTAHDWWYVTGRCGFIRDCTGWRRACGECGAQRHEDLPSLFDRSAATRARRMKSLASLGGKAIFACPSRHLAADYAFAMPWARVSVVPNGTDLEFEAAVAAQPDLPRSGLLFSASDLAAPGKIDAPLLEALAAGGGVEIKLAGRNNPFSLPNTKWVGDIRGRAPMVELLKSSEALMFCSRMDNAPLTIIEAMLAGSYVVAFDTPAAAEMIEAVGGRCVADRQEAISVIRSGRYQELYGGLEREALARRAQALFSGDAMVANYLDLYRNLLTGEELAPDTAIGANADDETGRGSLARRRVSAGAGRGAGPP